MHMYSVFDVTGYFIYVLGSMDVCLLYTILCVYVMYIFCACIHTYVYRELKACVWLMIFKCVTVLVFGFVQRFEDALATKHSLLRPMQQ